MSLVGRRPGAFPIPIPNCISRSTLQVSGMDEFCGNSLLTLGLTDTPDRLPAQCVGQVRGYLEPLTPLPVSFSLLLYLLLSLSLTHTHKHTHTLSHTHALSLSLSLSLSCRCCSSAPTSRTLQSACRSLGAGRCASPTSSSSRFLKLICTSAF